MHDGIAPAWRQTIDRHYAALADALTAQLDAEIEARVASAILHEREVSEAATAKALMDERTRVSGERKLETDDTRRRLSESFNQTLRRIRQTSAEHEALQLLLEESAPWAESAVVLLIENNQARIAAWRGAALRGDDDVEGPIELSEAAAIASCVESRDLLVALADPAEISPVLASALSGTGGTKVYLFPVAVRQNPLAAHQNVVALMLASGEVTPAPIELLCEATGMKLESLEAQEPVTPVPPVSAVAAAAATGSAPLVQIANAVTTWTSLTPDEQALHLRAQRTAKVRIAQIRISESEALRKGAQARDIYGALRPSLDAARGEYERVYMSQTPTMVDYLHLEIVRSLAHEDSRLLGRDYPGPIA